MKRWFVVQFLAASELFGWKVPRFIRKLLPEQAYRDLQAREQSLTHALRSPPPNEPELPPFLPAEIRRAIRRQEPQGRSAWPFPLPVMAAAAALLLGFLIWQLAPRPAVEEPARESLVQARDVSVESLQDLPAPPLPGIEDSATLEAALLHPLAQEQAYLAADLKNAVRFVAEGFVPSEYRDRIRFNLYPVEVSLE